MTWSTLPAIVGGSPVPKVAWLDKVTANLNLLGGPWTADPRATTAIWTTTGALVGNGSLVSRYRLAGTPGSGGTLDWLVILTAGSTTNFGSTQYTFAYPAGVSLLNPGAGVMVRYFHSASTYEGMGVANTATVNLDALASAIGLLAAANATTPFAWASTDVMAFLATGLEIS